jgi:hypothetical protein
MSDAVLTVLKFCLLALVYLFLFRVVWTVARELREAGLVESGRGRVLIKNLGAVTERAGGA